jgi:predicted acetyltransferase
VPEPRRVPATVLWLVEGQTDNPASWRIIEGNSGILEGVFQVSVPAHTIRRYWIE